MKNIIFFLFAIIISCDENSVDPPITEEPKNDYFPLEINNTWIFSLKKENGHRGWTEDKFNGTERWTVKSINRSSSDITYILSSERFGILTKLRTSEQNGNLISIITTDTIDLVEEFTILEDKNHFLQINREYFPYFKERQRYYSSNKDTLIKFDEYLYSSNYEVYRKGVGVIKRFNNQSTNTSLNYLELNLIKVN